MRIFHLLMTLACFFSSTTILATVESTLENDDVVGLSFYRKNSFDYFENTDLQLILAHKETLKRLSFNEVWGIHHTGYPNEFLAQLKEISFIHVTNLDETLSFISKQTNLESLTLTYYSFTLYSESTLGIIRDFSKLSTLTNLKELSLRHSVFSSHNLSQMQQTYFPNLETLDLACSVGVSWMPLNSISPNIKYLNLDVTQLEDVDFAKISTLSNLQKISLNSVVMTQDKLDFLSHLPNLTELSLARGKIAGIDLDFSVLQNLEILDLTSVTFTWPTLQSLFKLNNLKVLKITGSHKSISPGIIDDLQRALPNCRIEL